MQQNGVFRRFFMRVTLTTVSDWNSKPQDLHPHCCVIPRGMHRKNLREFVRFDHENESNATRNSYAPTSQTLSLAQQVCAIKLSTVHDLRVLARIFSCWFFTTFFVKRSISLVTPALHVHPPWHL